jgi:O-succinylbenzoic acid--CoA ligase
MSPRVLRALAAEPGDVGEWMSALEDAISGSGPALLPLPAGPAQVRSGLLDAFRPDDPAAPLECDDVAVVVPTSGSTGVPKGALLSAAALRASAAATHARLGGAGSWVLALPLTHVAGLMVLVRAIEGGGTVSRVGRSESFDATGFAAVTAAAAGAPRFAGEPLYTSLVPTQLARLLDAGVDLSAYSAILLGAAAAPDQLLARARAAGARVVTTYGMSETCGGCVYDGRPLDGTSVGIDTSGRVVIGGPSVFSGYRLRPDLTAEVLDRQGRFVTGDLGEVADDGRLQLLGRADDVIISGGENVAPAVVEAALAALPGIAACAVVGVADATWGERVVALVVAGPGTGPGTRPGATSAPTLPAVRAALAERLPSAWRPTRLVVVPAIPLLATGKPDRRALRALATEDSGLHDLEPPTKET